MRQSLHIWTCSFYRLSLARQHKETIQYLISNVQDLMLLKQPYIGPKSIIFEVISVVISVIPGISVNRRTGLQRQVKSKTVDRLHLPIKCMAISGHDM